MLKKEINSKIIYDVHDLYIETLNQAFPINKEGKLSLKHNGLLNVMRVLGRRFEQKVILNSDLIFTVNESCRDYLIKEYNKDVLYFRNYPEPLKLPSRNKSLSKACGISTKINLSIYIGSIGPGRHLINIVKSSAYLNDGNAIVIIGDGILKKELENIAEKDSTLNRKIFFLDQLPYNQLFETIAEAKLGLMILDPINKSKEYALANKISEYMLCGIPPLLSNHIEHIKLLEASDVGYLIKSYEPEAIAEKINGILINLEVLEKKSKDVRIAFEKLYNWEMEKYRFTEPLKNLISKC